MMDFYETLDQVLDLLRQRGRVTYRALERQFNLNDAYLEDLKDEIIKGQQFAVFWPSFYGPRFTAAGTLMQGPFGDALIEHGD